MSDPNQERIKKYAQMMKDGKWKLPGQDARSVEGYSVVYDIQRREAAMKLVSYTAPVEELIYQLLHAEVIECTIGVMRHLGHNLTALHNHLANNTGCLLTSEQKEHLKAVLLSLTSESIREALHKGELPITNSIIRTKNQILTTLGVEIPESHQEIKASDYPNYHW